LYVSLNTYFFLPKDGTWQEIADVPKINEKIAASEGDFSTCSDVDVLFYVGSRHTNHTGTIAFREHVATLRASYHGLPKRSHQRAAMVDEVRNWVVTRGGRFMLPKDGDGAWQEITEKQKIDNRIASVFMTGRKKAGSTKVAGKVSGASAFASEAEIQANQQQLLPLVSQAVGTRDGANVFEVRENQGTVFVSVEAGRDCIFIYNESVPPQTVDPLSPTELRIRKIQKKLVDEDHNGGLANPENRKIWNVLDKDENETASNLVRASKDTPSAERNLHYIFLGNK